MNGALAMIETFEPINPDERAALEVEWERGQLAQHVDCLLAFVARERGEILRLAEGQTDGPTLMHAVHHLIVCRGTLHPKAEMLEQIGEIQRELWYCGERGDYDTVRIKSEWAEKHGGNWRRWRTLQYLFAANRSAAAILEKLGSG